MMHADLLFDAGAELAEGPVWDERTNELVWVDILRGEVHRMSEDGSVDTIIDMGEHVGAVVLTEDGGMVAATKSGFRLVEADAGHPLLASLPDAAPGIRMNDGKCDPAGRFVAGTTAYDETPGAGSLFSFDGEEVKRLLSDVTISNGLAWSADGQTMYFIDTPTRRVDAFDYDVATGDVSNRRPVVVLPEGIGDPDGMTIDTEGGIWIALWGGACLRRYANGVQTHHLVIPAQYVTSCTLGGHDRLRIFVTTAEDASGSRTAGGRLFACDVDVPGPLASRMQVQRARDNDVGSA